MVNVLPLAGNWDAQNPASPCSGLARLGAAAFQVCHQCRAVIGSVFLEAFGLTGTVLWITAPERVISNDIKWI
jgi:hypothetical protein